MFVYIYLWKGTLEKKQWKRAFEASAEQAVC